jgi:hypothetical protein
VNPKTRILIACRIFEPELEMLRIPKSNIEIRYLDQGLHRYPHKMPSLVQDQIDQVAVHAGQVVLGYGLCSNGIAGVTAGKTGLIVPRCHDCIAFFLGSCSAYRAALKKRPGTYYLTAGWIREGQDPLGIIENDYTPRLGRKMAVWGMKEELKNYSHFVFINTGAGNEEDLRQRALENASFFNKNFLEIQGDLGYLKKLLYGPYSNEDFISIKAGERIEQKMFLDYPCRVC